MMGDSMTVLVALFALCVVTMVLIWWQVATLTDIVYEVQEDMHSTARWLARMVYERKEDGGNDDED